MDSLNYWQKLIQFKIYSQERRRERYIIVFLWKVSQGMVSGYNTQFSSKDGRCGRSALPHSLLLSSPASVRRAREYSLGVKGAGLFNLIPADIRNLDSENVEDFKKALDTFLENVPDQPTVPGLGRSAETNSLLHQIPQMKFAK